MHTLPLGDDDSMAILTEDEYDVNKSIDRCVYYANLHRMVPVDQSDLEVSGSKDADGNSSLPYVHAHKAHLVTPTKLDYQALRSCFAWLPADIVRKDLRKYNAVCTYALQQGITASLQGTSSCPESLYVGRNWSLQTQLCPIPLQLTAVKPGLNSSLVPSLLSDAYGMKTPAKFSSTLMDNITQ